MADPLPVPSGLEPDPQATTPLADDAVQGTTQPWADGTLTADGAPPSADGVRYRQLRSHARGGLGEVFVALDTEIGREVALKEIQDQFADDPASQGRFVREAEVNGRLEHPNIVPVYGLGRHTEGRPYYAMRFIRGEGH
jgi:serine/threonine protein kinase